MAQSSRREKRGSARWPGWLSGTIAILLTFCLLVVAATLSNLSLRSYRASQLWVEHTDAVILQIGLLEKNLLESRSAERGYLLAGYQEYLDYYKINRDNIMGSLESLRMLLADSPTQVPRLDAIRPLLEERIADMNELVAAAPSGIANFIAVLKKKFEKGLSGRIIVLIDQIRQSEMILRSENLLAEQRYATETAQLALATSLLAVLSAVSAVFLFMREHERHRLQEVETALFHATRLNSLGETALTLAHEVGQPLQAAALYVGGVFKGLEKRGGLETDPDMEALRKADAQISSANQILRQLRMNIGKFGGEQTNEYVDSIVSEAVRLVDFEQNHVTLRVHINPKLPPVFVDRVQIRQVLINLMRNANEAMTQSSVKKLTVSVSEGEHDTVLVEVTDTGPGLVADLETKIFQSLATTKADGMGVGLSICRRLIERNGGRIWLEANSARGAAFRFTLPIGHST